MTSTTSAPVTLGAVVVGVDASAPARAAALWAAEEADRRGRPLHIVHAADTDHRMLYAGVEAIQAILEAGRDLLTDTAEAVSDRYPGLIVTKELSRIDPVGGLRAAAGERGTIVVGSRGLGGFGALMLGSVGLGLAARNEAPVIVVRGELDRATTGVVTAAVHGASDLDWLMLAAAEAQARKASLRLLSVCNVLAQVGTVTTMLDSLGEVAKQQVHEVTAMAGRTGRSIPTSRSPITSRPGPASRESSSRPRSTQISWSWEADATCSDWDRRSVGSVMPFCITGIAPSRSSP